MGSPWLRLSSNSVRMTPMASRDLFKPLLALREPIFGPKSQKTSKKHKKSPHSYRLMPGFTYFCPVVCGKTTIRSRGNRTGCCPVPTSPPSRAPNHYANPALESPLPSDFLCTGKASPGRARVFFLSSAVKSIIC